MSSVSLASWVFKGRERVARGHRHYDQSSMNVTPLPPSPEGGDHQLRLMRDEDRLNLLRWVGAPERSTYLGILAVFDSAKASYDVQLRPTDVQVALRSAGSEIEAEALARYLDSLHQWGVLERSFDSSRVASIEEYRRRRPVFQFTELGERAYRGVRELLDAEPGEGHLQRFALREIAEQLEVLHAAVVGVDGDRALAALNRVDMVLAQLADRAGQFYVLVGVMTQQVEVNATRFIEMKDLLLGHLYEFLQDLHRWTPVIAQRIADIETIGVATTLALVTASDGAVFLTPEKREAAWIRRWDGLVSWFSAAATSTGNASGNSTIRTSQVAQLDRRTVAAIRELTALLRRLLEARGRGASRAVDLVGLARWFWSLDGAGVAAGQGPHGISRRTHGIRDTNAVSHALFDATFGLGGACHLGAGFDDVDLIPTSTPWAQADPVDVSISLRERGRAPSPGQTASIPDDRRDREHLRARARDRIETEQRAARDLATFPLVGRILERAEFEVLLRLADLALEAGVPVTGSIASASIGDVRVELRRSATDTLITVVDGTFVLQGVSIKVGAALAQSASGA